MIFSKLHSFPFPYFLLFAGRIFLVPVDVAIEVFEEGRVDVLVGLQVLGELLDHVHVELLEAYLLRVFVLAAEMEGGLVQEGGDLGAHGRIGGVRGVSRLEDFSEEHRVLVSGDGSLPFIHLGVPDTSYLEMMEMRKSETWLRLSEEDSSSSGWEEPGARMRARMRTWRTLYIWTILYLDYSTN